MDMDLTPTKDLLRSRTTINSIPNSLPGFYRAKFTITLDANVANSIVADGLPEENVQRFMIDALHSGMTYRTNRLLAKCRCSCNDLELVNEITEYLQDSNIIGRNFRSA